MIVIPTASRVTLNGLLLAGELDLHIYQNDFTPSDATVIGNFTEATFTGYAVVNLVSSTYVTTPGGSPTDPVTAAYGPVSFISTATQTSQDCYGYYITRRATGDLVWCERFTAAPFNITTNGDAFTVDPRFNMDTADNVPEV